MIFRILLPFLMVSSLFALGDSLTQKMDIKIEAGLYLPTISGDISNTSSRTDLNDDLGFNKSTASYFSFEYRHSYNYLPNIYISYFNMKKNADDSNLSKDAVVADATFSSGIKTASTIEYSTLNTIFYQDFLIKGKTTKSIFGQRIYLGDLEFDIGLNIKNLSFLYSIQNKSDLSIPLSWIRVNEFIPLPYFGFKYYRYNVTIYGDISALSFSEARSTTGQLAIDYRVVAGLYLTAGYLYESVDVVEDGDTVVFDTSGVRLGFRYKF